MPCGHALALFVAVLVFAFLGAAPAGAQEFLGKSNESARFDPTSYLAAAFPGAESFGERMEDPAVYPAYKDGELIGYAFFSVHIMDATGYSAKPMNVAVGLSLDGRIVGAHLVEHHEPILIIGVQDKDLHAFIKQYRDIDILETVRIKGYEKGDGPLVDGITGATISSLSLNRAVLGASRAAARGLGLFGVPGQAQSALKIDEYELESWPGLRADRSVARLRVEVGKVAKAFERQGFVGLMGLDGDPKRNFLTLYTALVNPAQIGRNLLGDMPYAELMSEHDVADSIIFVGAQGSYSFKGTAYRRSGVFDRVEIIQGSQTYRLTAGQYRRVDKLTAATAPELREMALFTLKHGSGFDPTRPWRLVLLVDRDAPDATGRSHKVFSSFSLPYSVPARHLAEDELLVPGVDQLPGSWFEVWQKRWMHIAIIALALTALTGILFFQDNISRQGKLYSRTRWVALLFTFIWVGWYAGAQLSVINVLTFIGSLLGDFNWMFFLLDPVAFVLWSYVAVLLLFWGRGVFCGWLCPFGAMQELINKVALLFKVPQITVPFNLHERLWTLKYIIFLGLFALSLSFTEIAVRFAEVEPFKTVMNLKFDRPWPWLIYPLLLLASGVFINRLFCRYICPLGAALAIPARIRMFEWLKRRPICGSECGICAQKCPIQAIHPTGRINPNECIHCLECQTTYYDDQVCPPMVSRCKRLTALAAADAKLAEAGFGE